MRLAATQRDKILRATFASEVCTMQICLFLWMRQALIDETPSEDTHIVGEENQL